MSEQSPHEIEADRLTRYLLGVPAGDREKRIYADAMAKMAIVLTAREAALWRRMLQSRFWLACSDAGLALLQPASPLRRKVFVMLAILEASPTYTAYFLSREFSLIYPLKIGIVAFRAAARGLIGVAMVKGARLP